MTRVTSLLIAFLGTALALWATGAGAHAGPHHAQVHASAEGANLAGAIAATRAPQALPAVSGQAPCPANDGGACCCQVDRAATPEPRLLAASVTGTISRRPPAQAPPVRPPDEIVAARSGRVGAVGSRGPPSSP